MAPGISIWGIAAAAAVSVTIDPDDPVVFAPWQGLGVLVLPSSVATATAPDTAAAVAVAVVSGMVVAFACCVAAAAAPPRGVRRVGDDVIAALSPAGRFEAGLETNRRTRGTRGWDASSKRV